MKVFSWISKRTSQAQPEVSTKNAARERLQWTKKNTTHQDQGALFSLHDPVVKEKCEELLPIVPKQRREIVKIFVNYEEYGLLAIGTLGYDPSTGVEPEFELFELKPGALQGVRGLEEKQESTSPKDQQQDARDEDFKKTKFKKMFPLERLTTHIPHVSPGFLKGSKLADRILHPLNYLRVSRNIRTSPSLSSSSSTSSSSSSSSDTEGSKSCKTYKKKSFTSKLKALTHTSSSKINGGSCDIIGNNNIVNNSNNNTTNGSSSSCSNSRKQITYENDKHHDHQQQQLKTVLGRSTRLKNTFSQFSCIGGSFDDEDQDEEGDEYHNNTQGNDNGSKSASEPLQDTCARDVSQQGYWIRTESDYVVLEL